MGHGPDARAGSARLDLEREPVAAEAVPPLEGDLAWRIGARDPEPRDRRPFDGGEGLVGAALPATEETGQRVLDHGRTPPRSLPGARCQTRIGSAELPTTCSSRSGSSAEALIRSAPGLRARSASGPRPAPRTRPDPLRRAAGRVRSRRLAWPHALRRERRSGARDRRADPPAPPPRSAASTRSRSWASPR